MTAKTYTSFAKQYGTAAERAAFGTGGIADGLLITFVETDTGDEYEYTGSWRLVGVGGAALVSDHGQAPSSYSGIVALSTTAASETIATGAKSVVVTNLDATAANYAILAFGTDAADAETNLASGGWTVRANSEKSKAVPPGAGGIAYKSAAGTPSIELTWG